MLTTPLPWLSVRWQRPCRYKASTHLQNLNTSTEPKHTSWWALAMYIYMRRWSELPGVFSVLAQVYRSAHLEYRDSRFGVPDGIRTRVTAVKGRCPGPLDDGDAASRPRSHQTAANFQSTTPPCLHKASRPAHFHPRATNSGAPSSARSHRAKGGVSFAEANDRSPVPPKSSTAYPPPHPHPLLTHPRSLSGLTPSSPSTPTSTIHRPRSPNPHAPGQS